MLVILIDLKSRYARMKPWEIFKTLIMQKKNRQKNEIKGLKKDRENETEEKILK